MKNSEKSYRATTRFSLFLFLIVIGFTLQAQTLSEKLGAVPTNFRFFSGETDLEVNHQFIIKNAGSYNYTGTTFDAGYGYGAGYEVFRLEFMTRKKLTQESQRKTQHHFRIGFYNADGKLLCSYNYPAKKVSVARNLNNDDGPLFYSIDLLDIPLSLFDFTEKIDIIEVQ
jgi:hypothetical protein